MTNLKVGDSAPEINSTDQNGNPFSLENVKGKKIILYFYPKDLTPGCTDQSCNLRDNYTELKKLGFEVIGVSTDDAKSHKKFISKHNLPFTLLADTEKKVVHDYGVWGPKQFMGKNYDGINRTTFIIDENSKIENIITKVNTKSHAEQVLEELGKTHV